MVDLQALTSSFQELYQQKPRIFSAPGRVNLIGEHTDYNDGFVLPMAVDRRTLVAAQRNEGPLIRVYSLDLKEAAEIDLAKAYSLETPRWLSYLEGVARVLQDNGVKCPGANLAILSDVPMGSGLSSSAALEMSVGFALMNLAGAEIDLIKLALAGQKAEHDYAGTKSGLMDQLAAAFGKQHHALLIDCRTLERIPIALRIAQTQIVVCDTNVKHELAGSAYNERRAECERGVELLKQKLPHILALRDVSVQEFQTFRYLLPDPINRRCHHVVTENERTLKAAEVLQAADVNAFGRLMLESHKSLRDDYEVSCPELDLLVELAMQHEGVAGARMTGGGFGGCTVNLVQQDQLESFCEFVMSDYTQRTGIRGVAYVVKADEGVKEVLSFEY